jgi:hypothetical protein
MKGDEQRIYTGNAAWQKDWAIEAVLFMDVGRGKPTDLPPRIHERRRTGRSGNTREESKGCHDTYAADAGRVATRAAKAERPKKVE